MRWLAGPVQVECLSVGGGSDGRRLVVRWSDADEPSIYPYSWLRDNCRCRQCFDHANGLRTLAFHDLNIDASVVNAQVPYRVGASLYTVSQKNKTLNSCP